MAQALPEFPGRIHKYLALDYDPPCSICHQYGKTGGATPIEPFAYAMRARGLTGDDSTLATALAADESSKADSDGDGIPDTVELTNGTDPNSVANDCIIPSGTKLTADQCTPGVQASPGLGCSTGAPKRPGRRSDSVEWLLGMLGVVALGALARTRRSRRARP